METPAGMGSFYSHLRNAFKIFKILVRVCIGIYESLGFGHFTVGCSPECSLGGATTKTQCHLG